MRPPKSVAFQWATQTAGAGTAPDTCLGLDQVVTEPQRQPSMISVGRSIARLLEGAWRPKPSLLTGNLSSLTRLYLLTMLSLVLQTRHPWASDSDCSRVEKNKIAAPK